jgi:uncharacterized protein (UPF0332 family)
MTATGRTDSSFVLKALESPAGAESEFANARYNNRANRCYYACFQAAIAALQNAGVTPGAASVRWSHSLVPAQFDGQLINRRKLYPSELRGTLSLAYTRRQVADYSTDVVTHTQAARILRRTRALVQAITARTGEPT